MAREFDNYWNKCKYLETNFYLLISTQVDEIYHLASPASPPHYMQNPVKTIKTNTLGEFWNGKVNQLHVSIHNRSKRW